MAHRKGHKAGTPAKKRPARTGGQNLANVAGYRSGLAKGSRIAKNLKAGGKLSISEQVTISKRTAGASIRDAHLSKAGQTRYEKALKKLKAEKKKGKK
jgi:hypothetical protein